MPRGADWSRNNRGKLGLSGELDHAPRRFDRKAVVDFGGNLLGRVAVIGIVDHGLCGHARPAHDKGAGHHIGLALDVRAATPIDHGNTGTTSRTCLRAATAAVPRSRPKEAAAASASLWVG